MHCCKNWELQLKLCEIDVISFLTLSNKILFYCFIKILFDNFIFPQSGIVPASSKIQANHVRYNVGTLHEHNPSKSKINQLTPSFLFHSKGVKM
jgi:hypothetical protein